MSVLPPMYDAKSISKEIDGIVLLQGLAVEAVRAVESIPTVDAEDLLQKQYTGSFIHLGSTFEFGLRQVLDYLAFVLAISSDEVHRKNLAGLKTLKATLLSHGFLKTFFASSDWSDILLLNEVRNKIVHVLGWHDDIEFTAKANMILFRYGLVMARGYHPAGSVTKFLLSETTSKSMAHLYKRAIEQIHLEIREPLNANP